MSMNKAKRIFLSATLYSCEEDKIHREIQDFCERESEDVDNFKFESHSIIKNEGQNEYCRYEGSYRTPDTFDINIVYSCDYHELDLYICIDKTSLNDEHPRSVQFRADSEKNALFEAKCYFSVRGSIDIKESDILCLKLEDINKR